MNTEEIKTANNTEIGHEMLINYLSQIADNALILGHRLSEWCGHGPILEQDIALANIALDHVGLARNVYQYMAEIEGGDKTEDYYPYLRSERAFRNVLLVEQPNGNFADTIVRSFLFDTFQCAFLTELEKSDDRKLAAIAAKSLKEVKYHRRFSSEWMIRLGDGTEESHQKVQEALYDLWAFTAEVFEASKCDEWALNSGVGVSLDSIKNRVETYRSEILREATLKEPDVPALQSGGKKGIHTEHFGYILTEMQYIQRSYPGCEW